MDFYNKCRGSLFHPGGFGLTKRAIEFCGFAEGSVIADIGCGIGETSKLLEKSFPIEVMNVEPSAAMAGGKSGIIAAPAENTPFDDNYLDGALCECVLSLCNSLNDALTEMHRIIKPKGYLIVSDVYSKSGRITVSGALKNIYPKDEFASYIRESGFEIILFEEHDRELAKLAARMIMDGEDCEAANLSPEDLKNTGYFLLIARKL